MRTAGRMFSSSTVRAGLIVGCALAAAPAFGSQSEQRTHLAADAASPPTSTDSSPDKEGARRARQTLRVRGRRRGVHVLRSDALVARAWSTLCRGAGEVERNARWKVSGRVDGDIVYATSDFYLPAVKRDQRLDFFWGENYVDFSAGDWDFRLGAQQIVWGEVIGLFFADVVSARDMREFLLPGFDIIRIPQWAARAEYAFGDSHVELLWIPVPTFDKIGKPGSDFYPARLPSPTPEEIASLFRDPVKPSRSLDNSSLGIRASTLVNGWDLAAFYYHSYSTEPTFYRVRVDRSLTAVRLRTALRSDLAERRHRHQGLRRIRLSRRSGVRARARIHGGRSDLTPGRRAAIDARLHPERRVHAARRYAPQHPGLPAHLLPRKRRSACRQDGRRAARRSTCRRNSQARSSRSCSGYRTSAMLAA